MRQSPQWQWHLDEVFVKIRGKTHYLWRAVDHEGEVLESFVTKTRDKASALKFMRKAMKRYGNPSGRGDGQASFVSSRNERDRERGPPGSRPAPQQSRREFTPTIPTTRAGDVRFRRMRSLQKFASIHSSVYNHFNHQRNIESRARFKSLRDAALLEWRELIAA
jgi:putative transposase